MEVTGWPLRSYLGVGVQILLSPHLDTTWVTLETGAEGGLSVITLVIDLKFTGRRVGQLLQLRDPVSL